MQIIIRFLFNEAYAETWLSNVKHVFLTKEFLVIQFKNSSRKKWFCARDVFSYSLVENDVVKHTFFIKPLENGGYEITHE